jgi:signal transduction histidine kinase
MRFFLRRPRTLKGELQILFLAVGSGFLVLATILLFQNGQAALRRQLAGTATTAAETAASLIVADDHRQIRAPQDMNTPGFRTIVEYLGALRRANPAIYHLFTLAPVGRLGAWGVVVDMGGAAPIREESSLRGGRMPIGSPPPASVPAELLRSAMTNTACEVLDLSRPERARVVAVSPIRARSGESVGLVVVELSAAGLIAEAHLLWYVTLGIFVVGLAASVVASSAVSRWVTRPIDELLRGVEQIARGRLETRIQVNARNELGALGEAVNQMAQSLEASQALNSDQQARLRDLHQLGSLAAATLELPRMLEVAAHGLRSICGGDTVVVGAAGRRDRAIRVWAVAGESPEGALPPRPSVNWEVPLDPLAKILGSETRLLSRAELSTAGFSPLAAIPGSYALTAPLRVNEEIVGAMVAFGEAEQFHADAVSLASLFAAQVAAAVGNARLFEQVKELDRSKSEFLSIASHEVRTPLTVMKSSLDLLVSSSHFDESSDQRQLIAFCQESVERLIRLVKDILDVSKIEAGVLSIQFLPTSLNELIEKCLFWVPQLPGGQGIEVDARLPKEPAMVFADPSRIQQVLENLISNALKFSKPGGRVSIELKAREQEYEVIVSDQGKGIAPDDLERIFRKFFQVEDAATREQGGTGLGLAICRGIIEGHRGRLWAESTPGQGSSFHFTLARVLDTPIGERTDAEISVASLLSSLRTESASPPKH